MKRTFLIGLSAAIIGGLGLALGTAMGISFQGTVIGVGGGVIAAIVAIGSPLSRLCGFLIGFGLGIAFDAMRLGLLPGGASVAGQAVALAVILIVITLVSGVTAGRISAWSMLLGSLTFIVGFVPVMQQPWTAAEQFPSLAFNLLAMAAIGFLTVVPAEMLPEKPRKHKDKAVAAGPPPVDDATSQQLTPLNQMLGGAK